MEIPLCASSLESLPFEIADLPVSFRFVGAFVVGVSAITVANSKKELGLLTGTFLLGLGVLELALQVAGA